MDLYDRNRDQKIDRTESVPILVDVYRNFSIQFNPNTQDIDSFYKVLDTDNDKQVTIQDLENLCIRYLTGSPLMKF